LAERAISKHSFAKRRGLLPPNGDVPHPPESPTVAVQSSAVHPTAELFLSSNHAKLQLPQRLSFFGEPQKLTCRRTSTSILIDAMGVTDPSLRVLSGRSPLTEKRTVDALSSRFTKAAG
jgi:hypothetical protein